jgi:hypothetical protein
VTITNQLVKGWEIPLSTTLRAGDLQITVEIRQQDGELPDTITVLPPPGYAAVPHQVILGEGETAIVIIVPALSS